MHTSDATVLDLARQGSGPEQRVHPRESFFQPVTILLDDGTELDGYSRDLSETGIGLVHRKPLPIALVNVRVELKGRKPQTVPIKICWCCATDDQWYLSGGQFVGGIE